MMTTAVTESAYVDSLSQWRKKMEDSLRSDTGWLTLTGLYWLNEGLNTIGSGADCDVRLPSDDIERLGVIELDGNRVTLVIEADRGVTIDGNSARKAVLRDAESQGGPSIVSMGSISFFVIRRSDQFAVRVRDSNNPARHEFSGRRWFPVDRQFAVSGRFVPHVPARQLEIENSVGQTVITANPGRVTFTLLGQTLSLEAFEAGDSELWFVFRDATSGRSTYSAARFMYAPVNADGVVSLDFNKAYHPPCAFTPYATCPLPPRDNILPVEITAGERN